MLRLLAGIAAALVGCGAAAAQSRPAAALGVPRPAAGPAGVARAAPADPLLGDDFPPPKSSDAGDFGPADRDPPPRGRRVPARLGPVSEIRVAGAVGSGPAAEADAEERYNWGAIDPYDRGTRTRSARRASGPAAGSARGWGACSTPRAGRSRATRASRTRSSRPSPTRSWPRTRGR